METRCQLCGGKIREGRCSDCGMDYTRRTADYRLNENRVPDTGTETRQKTAEPQAVPQETADAGKEKKNSATLADSWQKAARKRAETYTSAVRGGRPYRNKNKGLFLILAVTLVLVLVLVPLGFFGARGKEESQEEWTTSVNVEQTEVEVLDNTLYSEIGRIPESGQEGMAWELKPGQYLIGEDLPEGCYQVVTAEEEGTSRLALEDKENGLYLRKYIMGLESTSKKAGTHQLNNLRLYQGARLEIEGEASLIFTVDTTYIADEL